MGNVRKIKPGEREQLQAQIALLEERNERRREYQRVDYQKLIDDKQREIDNLRARLDHCDE
jgi:hypothetical protein